MAAAVDRCPLCATPASGFSSSDILAPPLSASLCPQAYEDEEAELAANYPVEGCAADRYLAASPADFKDEFESLPGDMNPLDPGET
jgi:hypothetical protein